MLREIPEKLPKYSIMAINELIWKFRGREFLLTSEERRMWPIFEIYQIQESQRNLS